MISSVRLPHRAGRDPETKEDMEKRVVKTHGSCQVMVREGEKAH